MEPITTEQQWNKDAMAVLWKHRQELGVDYQLDKLFKTRVKTARRGLNKITYTFSEKDGKKQGKLGFGRLYSKGSYGLEMMQNEIRGTLCQEYYYDVDVKNAQPVLLVQFAQRNFQTDLVELKKFCENRDEYYAQISDDRDIAKSSLFRVLYGGTCEFPFLLPLKEELDQFAFKLLKLPQYLELYKACQESKPENPRGSFLSLLAQTEERKVMLAMRDFFLEKGWSVDVLCFDGIMVRKEKGKELTEPLLQEAEAYVLKKTLYTIQLANKPFSVLDLSQFETDDEKILPIDVVVDDAYAAIELVKFAGDSLLTADGELFAEVDGVWLSGEEGMRRFISTHREKLIFKQEAKNGVKIHNYGGCEKNITPLLKQIKNFAKPGKLPIQYAYTLGTSTASSGSVEHFLSLVALWTRGKEAETEYVLSWLAHMIQKPTENPGVMIIVTGRKGCGKDTLADFISGYVVGRDLSKTYNQTEQFFDRYDSKHKKIFLKLEEANRFVCLKNQDVLKSFVTAETIEVNEKHKACFSTPNYCRFIFTTNKENPVAFTDQERRFLILPCSDEKVGAMDFWTQIRAVLFTPEAGKAVGQFLQARDIKSFNPRSYPVSEYQQDTVDVELSVEDRFITAWDGQQATATELFEIYKEFCIVNSFNSITTATAFGRTMLKFIRDSKIVKEKKTSGIYYKKP